MLSQVLSRNLKPSELLIRMSLMTMVTIVMLFLTHQEIQLLLTNPLFKATGTLLEHLHGLLISTCPL